MLIEINLDHENRVCLNVNQILYVTPNQNKGCDIFVNGGASYYTEEDYTTFVTRVRSVFRSYMKN